MRRLQRPLPPLSPPQFHQLPMFMAAGDLMDPSKVTPGDTKAKTPAGIDRMWGKKLSAADSLMRHGEWVQRPLTEEVRADGVREPVSLYHGLGAGDTPRLTDGHHRVAAANAVSPDTLVPVQHKDFRNTAHMLRNKYLGGRQ